MSDDRRMGRAFYKNKHSAGGADGEGKSPCKSEKRERLVAFLNRYSLLFHFALACALTFIVEAISRRSLSGAADFLRGNTLAFLYNALIIFATLSLAYLTRYRAQLRVLISGVWIFLGTVNGLILSSRVTPFSFTDLKCITDLLAMQNTNYFTIEEGIAAVAAIAAFAGFMAYLFAKGPRYRGRIHKVAGLVSIAALLLIGLPVTTSAAQKSNILASYFSNIAEGYEKYGFVYGFSTSVVGRGMDEPEDYSEERVASIEERVNSESEKTSALGSRRPNVICVLLESFVDPCEIEFLNFSKDPVPNFHKLERGYTSGHLTVPVVGAGTANTEFEVLTGMGMQFFGTGEYPYKTILKQTDCESIADALSGIGYATHVVHNNTATFYSRNNAFSQMGFDTFTSKELMNITQYTPNGNWPTDDVLVRETVKAMNATENQPDFVYTITVEGHGDYAKDNALRYPKIQVSGVSDPELAAEWQYYVNMIHEVDDFIGNLIESVDRRGEDTIIVFFGDHLPTMGLSDSDMAAGDIFKTKYVTWNNMGLEQKDADLAAYQLLAQTTSDIGIHEGTMFRYHQTQSGSADYLDGLENLQYDLLYGERYAYGGGDPYPASDLVMDVEDVSLASLLADEEEGKLIVYGSNFTKNTKVFVNGEKVATSYVNPAVVTISLSDVKEGDVITASILGSKDLVLREGVGSLTYEGPGALPQK